MNKRRLLKLADLLDADATNRKGIKFDLSTWGRSYNSDCDVSCGTAACAVGLAVLSGAFKRAGLKNNYSNESGRVCPEFDGHLGFDAAAQLFSIDLQQTNFLFCADSYPDNKTTGAAGECFVAKRIRDFVAGKVAA